MTSRLPAHSDPSRRIGVTSRATSDKSVSARAWQAVGLFLVLLVLGFATRRLIVDIPNLRIGEAPEGPDRQYALHPALAYAHIGSAVLYLLLAPLQLSQSFRSRHYALHRRSGRVLVPLMMFSTVVAIGYGLRYAVGGSAEGAATLVFGCWLLICLGRAWWAIRHRDVAAHRRWMIRAFVTALAVGTIRVWLGVFAALGLFEWDARFAAGFWLAFLMHLAWGEWWLRRHPIPTRAVRQLSDPG